MTTFACEGHPLWLVCCKLQQWFVRVSLVHRHLPSAGDTCHGVVQCKYLIGCIGDPLSTLWIQGKFWLVRLNFMDMPFKLSVGIYENFGRSYSSVGWALHWMLYVRQKLLLDVWYWPGAVSSYHPGCLTCGSLHLSMQNRFKPRTLWHTIVATVKAQVLGLK